MQPKLSTLKSSGIIISNMDPETAKKLMESKDVQAFVAYASMEMEKLNTVTDLDMDAHMDAVQVGMEVKARRMAYHKVESILEPLLHIQERSETFNKTEYLV